MAKCVSLISGSAGRLLGLFLQTCLQIVSMFGSCASTFYWSAAIFSCDVVLRFSAVSFADHFIPALAFNRSLLSASAA